MLSGVEECSSCPVWKVFLNVEMLKWHLVEETN